ncbi:tetratricopeptide repeat protein [Opitutaceae bacterium TAV1]|nr:tetratricopeptide repeat protein [Opitutaceae bacterium TAV1]
MHYRCKLLSVVLACVLLWFGGCTALRTPTLLTRQQGSALIEEGHELAAKGNHAGAIAAYDRALKLLPEEADAWYARGESHLALVKPDAALGDFSHVITLRPAMAEAWAARGQAYLAMAKPDEAFRDFTQALELDPKQAGIREQRGRISLDRGELDAALADFDGALALSPGLALAHLGRARVFHARGDTQGAIAAYSEAIAADPLLADAFRGRTAMLLEEKRFGEAARDIDSALVLAPRDASLWLARARVWRATGFPENALVDIARSLELSPRNTAALVEQALALEDTGDTAAALRNLDAVRKAAPDENFAWLQTARIYGKLRRVAEIPPLLTPFIEAHPQDAEALSTRGSAWLDLDRLDSAVADFRAALAINPDQHWARYLLSLSLLKSRKLDESRTEAEELITRAPDLALGYQARAFVEKEREETDAALADFGRAIERNHDAPFARIERARILLARGAAAEALADLDVAARSSSDPVVQINRGEALHRLGRLEEAVTAYQEALRTDPGLADARKDLGLLLMELNRLDEADEQLSDAGKLAPNSGDAPNLRGLVRLISADYPAAIDRFQEAIDDYKTKQSYVHLSLYLARRLTGLSDPTFSREIAGWDNPWLKQLGEHLLGRVSADDVLQGIAKNNLQPRERYLSEARFYIGMSFLLKGDSGQAREMLELASKSGEFRLYSRVTAAAWLRHGLPAGEPGTGEKAKP